MACDDDFGHGAHADGVTARARPVGVLSWGLIRGTREADVHTFVDVDAELLSDGLSLRDEFAVVRARHIREAWPEHLDVGADERVGEVVDVVADDHQIAYAEGLVDTTCGVGDEEVLDTEELHHTDREGDLLHGVAFVVVEAPLHAQHGYAREGTSDEIPLMADSRRV